MNEESGFFVDPNATVRATKSEEAETQIVSKSQVQAVTTITSATTTFQQMPPCLENHCSSQNLSFQHQYPFENPITIHTTPTMPPNSRFDFFFGDGVDDMEGSGGVVAYQEDYQQQQEDVTNVGRKRGVKRTKHVVTSITERQRRVDLSVKFDALKDLIPNLTKSDRASVVGDAVEYITELLSTVNTLKSSVENKRCEKQRMVKRIKVEESAAEGELENSNYNKSLRSCWIQRKSKDAEVDVRIVDDEVTIKIVQRKKVNCLLYVSHVLDELKLLLQYVASGKNGDFCSYFINSKICEGSTVYASAIANKLIEVMDTSLAAP